MANEQNLLPLNQRSKEVQREIQEKGRKANKEAHREKAQLKSAIKTILSLPVKDPKIKAQLKDLGMADGDIDNSILPALGLFKKACKGDSSAARLLAELNGENDVQGVTKIGEGTKKIEITFTDDKESGDHEN